MGPAQARVGGAIVAEGPGPLREGVGLLIVVDGNLTEVAGAEDPQGAGRAHGRVRRGIAIRRVGGAEAGRTAASSSAPLEAEGLSLAGNMLIRTPCLPA